MEEMPFSTQQEGTEGRRAKAIERRTSRIPSDLFLWGTMVAICGSLGLMIAGRKQEANFVGQWAPTLLLLGVYNKIVKVAGSERASSELH